MLNKMITKPMTFNEISYMLRSASEDMVNPKYHEKFKAAAEAINIELAKQNNIEPTAYRYRFFNADANQWHGWIVKDCKPEHLVGPHEIEPLYNHKMTKVESDQRKS